MQVAELVALGRERLQAAGIDDGMTDVHLLLGHCLKMSRTQVLLAAGEEVPANAGQQFLDLLARRQRREPLAYILGVQEFWSLDFTVSPAVLIPRPETEFLLEHVLRTMQATGGIGSGAILDLCCGSGVIAIVLALELQHRVIALDISAAALEVTGKNCQRHRVEGIVLPVQGNLTAPFADSPGFSLVVSNPPYVPDTVVRHELEPEVGEHEPRLALDGGERGLELIKRIRYGLPKILRPGGWLFMEIGYDQGEAVTEMFSTPFQGTRPFQDVRVVKDYAGRDRVLQARLG